MRPVLSSVKYFLVQQLKLSNKKALELLTAGQVLVNGKPAQANQPLQPEDEVWLNGELVKPAEKFIYLAYYKPRGIEATLNPEIADNLVQAIGLPDRVFPVGRLDKESEGLMLLTNDGRIFNQVIHSQEHQEKEYIVTVDKPLTEEAIEKLASGIEILGQKTRPAKVKMLNEFTFEIILTQGLNRQIRRMCYKLGYEVNTLKRIRIINLTLQNLHPGQWRNLTETELTELKNSINKA